MRRARPARAMRRIVTTLAAAGVLAAVSAAHAAPAGTDAARNEALVTRAMHELFDLRDTSAVMRYWGTPYVQHNPLVPNGREALVRLVAGLPKDFRYEPGMIVAQGDLVMLHGRYTGFGPKPLTTVDIFRIADGRIVEHWDVMQPDVPAARSKNGNPMFSPGE